MKKIGIILGLVLMLASFVSADVPQEISFQGRLTSNTGAQLADGNYSVTFTLYNQAGDNVWSTVISVATKGGYFNVILGKDGSVKGFAGVNFDQALFVGVKVEMNTEMSPRLPLSSVPFAFKVANGSVDRSKMVANAVGTTTIADSAITNSKLASAAVTSDKLNINAVVPVGTILPWYGDSNTGGVPIPTLVSITNQWVACNGQTISDAASPFNGRTVPNLNTTGRFLRGSSTAGTLQEDDLKSHDHGVRESWRSGNNTQWNILSDWSDPVTAVIPSAATATGGTETRPKNMSVIWIIKIK